MAEKSSSEHEKPVASEAVLNQLPIRSTPDTPIETTKDASTATFKETQKDASTAALKETQKDGSTAALPETQKDASTATLKETPKIPSGSTSQNTPKGSSPSSSKGIQKDASTASLKETQKDASTATLKETQKDASTATLKETQKDASTASLKETPKDASTATLKETSKASVQETPQDAAKYILDSATGEAPKATEQSIDPWNVSAGTDEHGKAKPFDYADISAKWNTNLIDDALLERFEKVTKHKPHRWLRRGLFFSHRDLDHILDCHEAKKPFMLYTGRGPSSGSMHIGHTVPFEFTKWLQDVFDAPLVIMLTDDEKFLFKDNLTLEEVRHFANENAKDIISVGFDMKKTFIYRDTDYIGGRFYQNALEFSRAVTFNQLRGAFGFDYSTNIGRIFFPSLQCIAAFPTSYPHIFGDGPDEKRIDDYDTYGRFRAQMPCLIPCAIDQDPYFRLVRDNAGKLKPGHKKPALIHSKFLTGLAGPGGKMSASDTNSAIFISDTPDQINVKITKSFSGGQPDIHVHRRIGGNPDVDVAYQYLSYFDDDDEKLDKIAADYRSGALSTVEMKKLCIDMLVEYTAGYQARKREVTDEVLAQYMTPRELEWAYKPPIMEKQRIIEKEKAEKREAEKKARQLAKKKENQEKAEREKPEPGTVTKNAQKKAAREAMYAAKKAAKQEAKLEAEKKAVKTGEETGPKKAVKTGEETARDTEEKTSQESTEDVAKAEPVPE